MIVPSLLFALGAHLAAVSPAEATAYDLDGASVDLRGATVLVVDPDDRGEVRQTLEGLKAQGKTAPGGPLTELVIVLDLSDVPSLLEGYAKGRSGSAPARWPSARSHRRSRYPGSWTWTAASANACAAPSRARR